MLQNFLLELEGKPAGRFFAATGGSVQADVLIQSSGPGQVRHKHIAGVKYEDMVLTCGTGMSRAFYDWIGNSFGGAASRKSGAVIVLDQKQAPIARLEFRNALVKSLVVPELDHSGHAAAVMAVSISPEGTRSTEVGLSQGLGVYASALPKAWNISDFRIRIDGLEADCTHVTRVGWLNLGQNLAEFDLGEMRSAEKEPTSLQYSDLIVRLPGGFSTGFYKWLDDFVVKGDNSTQDEKKGVLEFFAPKSNTAYFEIEFSGLGIYKIDGPLALASKTSLPITVSMYCEAMKFRAGPAAVI